MQKDQKYSNENKKALIQYIREHEPMLNEIRLERFSVTQLIIIKTCIDAPIIYEQGKVEKSKEF